MAAAILPGCGHGVGVTAGWFEATPCGQTGNAGFGAGRGVAAASAARVDAEVGQGVGIPQRRSPAPEAALAEQVGIHHHGHPGQ